MAAAAAAAAASATATATAPATAPTTAAAGAGFDAHMARGAARLLAADFPGALRAFDAALALRPASAPRQWMRGIACLGAGRCADGAAQFAGDLDANPDDVEEVVWAAMCRMVDPEGHGPAAARRALLPRPGGDARVPMREIFRLFSGAATPADVLAAAAAAADDATATAYAHLYLGLFFDCLQGPPPPPPQPQQFFARTPVSRRHYALAAAAPSDDFMGKFSVTLAGLPAAAPPPRPADADGAADARVVPRSRFVRDALEHPGFAASMTGCWQLSAGHHSDGPTPDELRARLTASIAAGFTTLDMGDIYTGVEEFVGDYLASVPAAAAAQVQIHTKLVPDLELLPTWTRAHTEAVVQRSQNRLGVPVLDLVQFHWWQWHVGDHVAAYRGLCGLRTDQGGPVRHVGVTNYDALHLQQLLDAGLPVASNQIQYSLLDRRAERALVPLCRDRGVRLLCYGVLAGGFLSDRWLGQPDPGGVDGLPNRSLVKYYLIVEEFGGWTLFQTLLAALRRVADRHGVDVATVAQAWVLSRQAVGGVILGLSGTPAHQDAALAAHRVARALVMGSTADAAEIAAVLRESVGPGGNFYDLERVRDGPHGKIMRYNCGKLWTEEHAAEYVRRAREWSEAAAGAAAGEDDDRRRARLLAGLIKEGTQFQFAAGGGGGAHAAAVEGQVAALTLTQQQQLAKK